MDSIINLGIMVVILFAITAVVFMALLKCYKRVENVNEVLVIKNYRGEFRIAEQGGLVFPLINSYYKVDYVAMRIAICYGDSAVDNRDNDSKYNAVIKSTNSGIRTKEKVSVDIRVEIKIKVNSENKEEVIRAVKMYGDNLSSAKKLGNHLTSSFEDIVKSVTIDMELEELLKDRDAYREKVKKGLGSLDGLIISDVAIPYVDHTPLNKLDPNNMFDNEGRQFLEKIIARKTIEIKEIEEDKKTQMAEKEAKGQQERLQLTKTLEQEKAKNEREIQNTQEEERTKIAMKFQEEELKRKQVEIDTDLNIEIAEESKKRDITNAVLSNQQAIGVKEQESRLEVNKKKIEADMITDKQRLETQIELAKSEKLLIAQNAENTEMKDTLVKKEEEIKDTQAFKDAERQKRVTLTDAEAKSESEKILKVNQAAAEKEAAEIDAARKKTEAEADFLVRQRDTDAGLLEVKLDIERKAAADKAIAEGKKISAEAIRMEGEAEAEIIAKKGSAEAEAIEKKGHAEAEALREKYKATDDSGDTTRAHELAKMEVTYKFENEQKRIETAAQVGIEAAKAKGQALANADLKIFGDNKTLMNVLNEFGKAEVSNTRLDNDQRQALLKDYVSGKKDLPEDLSKVLSSLGGSNEGEGAGNQLAQLLVLQKMMENPQLQEMIGKFQADKKD